VVHDNAQESCTDDDRGREAHHRGLAQKPEEVTVPPTPKALRLRFLDQVTRAKRESVLDTDAVYDAPRPTPSGEHRIQTKCQNDLVTSSGRLQNEEPLAVRVGRKRLNPLPVGKHGRAADGRPRHRRSEISGLKQLHHGHAEGPGQGQVGPGAAPGELRRRRRSKPAREREIETQVATPVGILMDFDCDEIRSGVQKRRAEGGGEVRVFIGPGDGAGGQRQIAHSAGRHVAAPDFQAVQIDHRAVVAQKVRVQACEQHRIRDGEDPSKVVGDEFRHGVGICSLFSIVGLFTRINALLLFGALSGAICGFFRGVFLLKLPCSLKPVYVLRSKSGNWSFRSIGSQVKFSGL